VGADFCVVTVARQNSRAAGATRLLSHPAEACSATLLTLKPTEYSVIHAVETKELWHS
jgi:hypothetical protein